MFLNGRHFVGCARARIALGDARARGLWRVTARAEGAALCTPPTSQQQSSRGQSSRLARLPKQPVQPKQPVRKRARASERVKERTSERERERLRFAQSDNCCHIKETPQTHCYGRRVASSRRLPAWGRQTTSDATTATAQQAHDAARFCWALAGCALCVCVAEHK